MTFKIFKKKISSEQIVINIKDNQDFEYTIQYIYNHHFDTVKHIILKMNGATEDAEDIFQEALSKVILSIEDGNFLGSSQVSTYLIAIAKNMWLKTLQKRNRLSTVEYDGQLHNDKHLLNEVLLGEEDDLDTRNLFESLLLQIGEDCQNILKYYYFKKMSYEKIHETFQDKYSSEQAIRNKKSRCLKYLKKGLDGCIDDKNDLLSIISSCF